MAEVWEGRDEVLNRPIAIKMLLTRLAIDATLRERFRREAVTAARLVHPGIVAIFDAGIEVFEEDGTGADAALGWLRERAGTELDGPDRPSTAYMVMELVQGETLRDLIAHAAPLSPEVAVAVTAQVADALAYAHARGLVHRDIKPANVLLSDEGAGLARVKVADFGIAKATAASSSDLTATGTLLGTPKYLSPEQVEGKEPDARADLYSLGVVLFEMLAGRPPFSAATDMATALAHVQQPAPRLEEARPDVPKGLAELVGALLAKDPADRVPSAGAVRSSLAALGGGLGLSARVGSEAYVHMPGPGRSDGRASENWPVGLGNVLPQEASIASRAEELRAGGDGPGGTEDGALGRTGVLGQTGDAPALSSGGSMAHLRGGRAERAGTPSPGRGTSVVVGCLVLAGCLAILGLLRSGAPPGRPAAGSSGSSATGTLPSSSFPLVRVRGVRELTQDGNRPNDNVGELPNIFDGNASTVWESDVYHGPNFGGSGGFGLALQLVGPHTLHELLVQTPMHEWGAEIFVRSSYASRVSGWGPPTGSGSNLNGNSRFSLGGRRGEWVLLWMTDPGPTRQAVIAEISVR
jgi:serine/threonine-protein kinase